MFCRLGDFTGFAIRQQELAKAAAIGVKWQDIVRRCREIAERKPFPGCSLDASNNGVGAESMTRDIVIWRPRCPFEARHRLAAARTGIQKR
jgi:hypothetical protein